jgi:hypothetical protein
MDSPGDIDKNQLIQTFKIVNKRLNEYLIKQVQI